MQAECCYVISTFSVSYQCGVLSQKKHISPSASKKNHNDHDSAQQH